MQRRNRALHRLCMQSNPRVQADCSINSSAETLDTGLNELRFHGVWQTGWRGSRGGARSRGRSAMLLHIPA